MNKIKPALLNTLLDHQGRSFTAGELTKHYVSQPDSLHKNTKPARQFVYRNMLRLIKLGMLDKIPNNKGWPRYRLNQNFDAHFPREVTSTTSKPERPYKRLRERLNKHRSEMLCALGEAEEYEALCREVPELCEEAQTLYNEARERSSLLLGKIKALESLLIPHDVGNSQ